MKVKYKVVKRKTRTSAILHGNSKYAKRYPKGESVYAGTNTMGILIFKTLKAARFWANQWIYYTNSDLIILKVIPLGRGKTVKFISIDLSTEGLDNFYNNDEYSSMGSAPNDTMAYPGVQVLD